METEKAIVTFKDPNSDKKIVIDFVWNKETNDLDYNITFSKNYSLTENLDFNGFLANMFLNCLQATEEDTDE